MFSYIVFHRHSRLSLYFILPYEYLVHQVYHLNSTITQLKYSSMHALSLFCQILWFVLTYSSIRTQLIYFTSCQIYLISLSWCIPPLPHSLSIFPSFPSLPQEVSIIIIIVTIFSQAINVSSRFIMSFLYISACTAGILLHYCLCLLLVFLFISLQTVYCIQLELSIFCPKICFV